MKKYFLIIIIFIFSLPLRPLCQIKHKVVLNNGTILRGRLVENDSPDVVLIKTLDGSLHSCNTNTIQEIGKTSRGDRHCLSLERPFGVFLRPEICLGWGWSANISMGVQIGPFDAFYCGTERISLSIWYDPIESSDSYDCFFIGNRLYLNLKNNSLFLDARFGMVNYKYIELDNYPFYSCCYDSNSHLEPMFSFGIGKCVGSIELGIRLAQVVHNLKISDVPQIISIHHYLSARGYIDTMVAFTLAYNLRKTL